MGSWQVWVWGGEARPSQETSEEPLSPSHFSAQPTDSSAGCWRGGVSPSSPPSSGWGYPGLGSQDSAYPSLSEEAGLLSPYSLLLPPKEQPEGHLWKGGAPT